MGISKVSKDVQLTGSNVEQAPGSTIPASGVLIGGEDASGDFQVPIIDANKNIGVNPAPLSKDIDSVDVAKMSKGGLLGALGFVHSEITASVLLADCDELDCSGYNSVSVAAEITIAEKNWTFAIYGCHVSGGTFIPWDDGATAMSRQINASRGWTWKGIPSYIKIVPTENEDGATVTVTAQPLNV